MFAALSAAKGRKSTPTTAVTSAVGGRGTLPMIVAGGRGTRELIRGGPAGLGGQARGSHHLEAEGARSGPGAKGVVLGGPAGAGSGHSPCVPASVGRGPWRSTLTGGLAGGTAHPVVQSAGKRLGQGSEPATAAFLYRGEGPQEPLGAAALRAQPLAPSVGSRLPTARRRSAAEEHRRERREWGGGSAPCLVPKPAKPAP